MVTLQVQFLLIPSLMSIMGAAQYMMQDAALLRLKKRLQICNQEMLEYMYVFQEFSRMVLSHLAGLNTDKAEVKREVEYLLTRMEHAQRDTDYFGSVRDSNACVEVHEDLLKQQLLEDTEE